MAARYTQILEDEMVAFLGGRGFKPLSLEGTKEKVFGKILRKNTCLRVYTSIADGDARDVGKDAIRCTVFTRTSEGVRKLGGAKRVHRVENWKTNLASRIEEITKKYETAVHCPKCNAEMALRKGKNGSFYGCTTFPACNGTKPVK